MRVLTRGQREISTMRGAYVLVVFHPLTIGLRIRHEFETDVVRHIDETQLKPLFSRPLSAKESEVLQAL